MKTAPICMECHREVVNGRPVGEPFPVAWGQSHGACLDCLPKIAKSYWGRNDAEAAELVRLETERIPSRKQKFAQRVRIAFEQEQSEAVAVFNLAKPDGLQAHIQMTGHLAVHRCFPECEQRGPAFSQLGKEAA